MNKNEAENENIEEEKLNFDEIMSEELNTNIVDKLINEIEITNYHIILFILMNIYIAGEGFIMIGNSLLIPIVTQIWSLSDFKKGLLGGSVFLGFTGGSLFSGMLSDSKGRKTAFFIGLLFSIFGVMIGLMPINFYIICLSNILNGIGIGISIPSIFSLCSEILNERIRNFVIGIVFIAFTIGEFIGCYVARSYKVYIITEDNWKYLLYLRLISVYKA